MRKLTKAELQKIANATSGKKFIKAKKIKVPEYDKYDKITIAKNRTKQKLGIWHD